MTVVLITSPQARADVYWTLSPSQTGDWSVAANWGGLVPTGTDSAWITNGGTVTVTQLGETCGTLSLGSNSGSGTVLLTDGSLSAASNEYVGSTGTGVFMQSGGINNMNPNWGSLYLGNNAGNSGTYNLSGNGQVLAFFEYVGYSGTGIFTQSGGINKIDPNQFSPGSLCLGYSAGSSGTYNLSDSGLLWAGGTVYVGNSGSGTFTQTGGTMNNSDELVYLGNNAGSSGRYFLTGGLLSSWAVYVGYSGTGTFTQTAGTVNDPVSYGVTLLCLGYNPSSTGTYNLSGNGQVSADSAYVGYSGSGTFMQSGGTNSIGLYNSGPLFLGSNAGGSGAYNLSGSGQLSAGSEFVGSSGTGTFTQTGGTNTVSSLSIGSSGVYLLAGGVLQVNSTFLNNGVFAGNGTPAVLSANNILDLSSGTWQNLGALSVSMGANSLLIVPAGFDPATAFASYSSLGLTHTLGTTLTVPAGQGFAGSHSISDPVDCQGTIMAISGGSINLNNGLVLSGSGAVNLNGGNLIVNDNLSGMSGGSLSVGNHYVGYGGTGTFTQSGGLSNISIVQANSGSLCLGTNAGDSGTYNLSGSGQLSALWNEYVGYSGIGTFAQSAGTNFTGTLCLGYNVGSSGTYSLSGGTLSTDYEVVGNCGVATFSQAAGTNTLTVFGSLLLGNSAGGSGTYFLGGGGMVAYSEYIGSSGTGAFTQTGGTNNIGNYGITSPGGLYVGNNPGSSGTYNLSGSGLLSATTEYVGPGNGVFLQSGGTNSVYSLLVSGVYSLSGGQLSASYESIGYSGSGSFTQSGGTNSASGLLFGYDGSSGTYNLNAGLLILSGVDNSSGTAAFNINGGTLQAGSRFFASVPVTLGDSGTAAIFDTAGFAMTFSGQLSGPGSLIKVDSGTLILAASNTYSGNTLISGGTLALSSSLALQNSTLDTSGSGMLSFGSLTSATIGELTGPGVLNLANSSSQPVLLSVGNNGTSTTFSGILQGAGSLIKSGSGTLTLAANNRYKGATFINGGILSLANSAALPGSGNITFGGGTLQYTNGNSSDYSSYIVNSAGPISIDTSGANVTFASGLASSNTGGLTKFGSGTLTLEGADAFGGDTLISSGTLALGNALALQQSTLDTSGSGWLNFGSLTAVTLGGLAGPGTVSLSNSAYGAVAVTLGQNNTSTTYSGTLTGAGSLTKIGSGALTLTGNNAFSGETLINSGTLNLANPLAAQNSTVNVSSSGALTFAAGNTNPTLGGLAGIGNVALTTAAAEPAMLNMGRNGQSTTYGGSLSGAGGLTKVGTGTLTLANINSYIGPTVIQGGTLQLGAANRQTGISMQWSTGSQYAITSGTAGAFGLANWNFSTSLSGTLSHVVDGSDTFLPGTSIAWTAQGGPYSNGGQSDSNIHKLLSGGLESQSTTVGSSYITVSGIPYSSYNVYVYVSGWDATRTGYMEINQNAAGYTAGKLVGFQAFQNSSQGTLTTYTAPTTGSPQLTDVLFSGVSGSNLTVDWQKNSNNVMVSAIQIVTRPVPTQDLLPITTPLAIATDATLDLSGGSQQVASLSDYNMGGGSIINSNSAASVLTLSGTNGSTTFSGMIQGGGSLGTISLVMSGSGTQVLAGGNSYTGSTTVNGGVLKVGAANTLSPNSNVLINGGTLDATAFPQTVQSLTVGSSGSLNLSLGSLFISSSAATLGGTLNLFGVPTAATQELISCPSFSGSFSSTSLNSGSIPSGYSLRYTPTQLDLVLNQFISAGNSLNWSDSSNWTFGTASNGTSQPAVLSASTTAAVTVTLDEPVTLGTLVLGNSGSTSAGYTISGTGANTLTFNNAGHGSTIGLTGGSHVIDAPVVLADNLTVRSGSANSWTLSFDTASSIAQSGTGSYSLTMNGAGGTLILSGSDSDSYTGGTNVEAGTLIVTNSEAIPNGTSLTVGAGALSIFGASNAPAAVPEPSTFVLLGIGAISLVGYAWRRRRT
jgi:autotransporter-associated beta strand protein